MLESEVLTPVRVMFDYRENIDTPERKVEIAILQKQWLKRVISDYTPVTKEDMEMRVKYLTYISDDIGRLQEQARRLDVMY